MTWGDPFSKFYKDDGEKRRAAATHGLKPGDVLTVASTEGNVLTCWGAPDMQSCTIRAEARSAVVFAIDCTSDPTRDWAQIMISMPYGTVVGWIPTDMVRLFGGALVLPPNERIVDERMKSFERTE